MKALPSASFFLPVLLQISALSQAPSPVTLVQKYLQARSSTMQLNATSSDVEKVLNFCTDDFVYEHPAAKAKIQGKDKVRAGMSGYFGLTKDVTYQSQILASNQNVVVAKVEIQFSAKKEDGTWKPGSRTNITVFEIENGKINRILDY